MQPAGEYNVVKGPPHVRGLPGDEEWADFVASIANPLTLEFTNLWRQEAKAINGIPLRKAFDFKTLVKYGRNLAIYKLTNGKWLNTFCGDTIVEMLNFELTNKNLEDYDEQQTVDFWMESMDWMTTEHAPVFETYLLDYTGDNEQLVATVSLPLKSDNHDFIDMFICHETYLKRSQLGM